MPSEKRKTRSDMYFRVLDLIISAFRILGTSLTIMFLMEVCHNKSRLKHTVAKTYQLSQGFTCIVSPQFELSGA